MGKLMAFSQERPAEGMEGREKEERQGWRVYGGVRLQTISDKGAKTNGGKERVKERERERGKEGNVKEEKRATIQKENESKREEMRDSTADIPARQFTKTSRYVFICTLSTRGHIFLGLGSKSNTIPKASV